MEFQYDLGTSFSIISWENSGAHPNFLEFKSKAYDIYDLDSEYGNEQLKIISKNISEIAFNSNLEILDVCNYS